jgi:hypothetical protein
VFDIRYSFHLIQQFTGGYFNTNRGGVRHCETPSSADSGSWRTILRRLADSARSMVESPSSSTSLWIASRIELRRLCRAPDCRTCTGKSCEGCWRDGGDVVIHDAAAVENEECIMNNAAPIDAAIAI